MIHSPQCPYCLTTFSAKSKAQQHVIHTVNTGECSHHQLNTEHFHIQFLSPDSTRCSICNWKWSTSAEYINHTRTHLKELSNVPQTTTSNPLERTSQQPSNNVVIQSEEQSKTLAQGITHTNKCELCSRTFHTTRQTRKHVQFFIYNW